MPCARRPALTSIRCPGCETALEVAGLLAQVTGYTTATDSGSAPCPACARDVEFRVGNGSLHLGYTYWAGSFHFETFETVPVPGLRLRRDGTALRIELPGLVVSVPGGAGPAIGSGP